MKYITIPKNSEHTIDLAAITNDYKGIIIVYKEGMAVGRISYCSDTELWYIDNAQFDTCKDTLLEVVNELIDIKHISDSFKLLEFYTNNDD